MNSLTLEDMRLTSDQKRAILHAQARRENPYPSLRTEQVKRTAWAIEGAAREVVDNQPAISGDDLVHWLRMALESQLGPQKGQKSSPGAPDMTPGPEESPSGR